MKSDYFVIVFVLLILLSLRKNYKNDFGPHSSVCVKGIFAIMVFLYHTPETMHLGPLLNIIDDTGYLSVAIFFFISGYGLTVQQSKKYDNSKSSLLKRYASITPPY